MDFDAAVAYMQALRRFGIKLGNERFEALMARLGDPHRRYGIAHVAGTKGKGSTTAMIASILQAHGFRVGGYYSPYVYDVRERVQVSGELIPREEFARLVTEIVPHVAELGRTGLGQTTEFELKTAVGFRYFADREVDFAAVEVGLGGRLDATNVVSPLVSVITNIGLDHIHILGDTHGKIAYEKAGIIKEGIPVITAADDPEALDVICRTAHEKRASLIRVGQDSGEIRWRGTGDTFAVRTQRAEYADLRLGLRGEYQRINAACAIGAVEEMARVRGFAIDPAAVRLGLERAYLPGRLEVVHGRPIVVMDGAHNALAARALAREIRRIPHERLLLVVGMIAGHAPESFLAEIAPLADRIYATQPTWIRGIPGDAIAQAARIFSKSVETITPPLAAAREALAEAGPDDLVLITGSFYVVGDIRPEELFATL